MAQDEFTPELNQQVLDALLRRIRETEEQNVAGARGEATSRSLGTGSTFEASLISGAHKNATTAATDAAVTLAVENAARKREERLLGEQRAYDTARDTNSYERDKSAADSAERGGLIQSGIGAAGNLGGQLLAAKLYGGLSGGVGAITGAGGVGAAGSSGALNLIPGGLGSTLTGSPMGLGARLGGMAAKGFTAGSGGLIGAGAGLIGGGYAGQSLAKLTGRNTREAKAGSAIGAGLGTAFFGPIGGIAGGAIGGLGTKAIQGVGKKLKKVFCFVANTPIEMADGKFKAVQDVELGDEVVGGTVLSVRASFTPQDTLCNYHGVEVTESHAVFENGEWIRVGSSPDAFRLHSPAVVYSLVTTEHRLRVAGILFADEHESDMYEHLTIEESLDYLNGRLIAPPFAFSDSEAN